MDSTEPREIKSRLVDTEGRERVRRVERVAWKRAHQHVLNRPRGGASGRVLVSFLTFGQKKLRPQKKAELES